MSDAHQRPADSPGTDVPAPRPTPTPGRRACEEDLAAEKARRRARRAAQQPGSAAEELRRLADAVAEKLAELGKPRSRGTAAARAPPSS